MRAAGKNRGKNREKNRGKKKGGRERERKKSGKTGNGAYGVREAKTRQTHGRGTSLYFTHEVTRRAGTSICACFTRRGKVCDSLPATGYRSRDTRGDIAEPFIENSQRPNSRKTPSSTVATAIGHRSEFTSRTRPTRIPPMQISSGSLRSLTDRFHPRAFPANRVTRFRRGENPPRRDRRISVHPRDSGCENG